MGLTETGSNEHGSPGYYTVLTDICTGLNLAVDDALLRSLNDKRVAAKFLLYQDIDRRVFEILDALKNKALKIGLVSNCSGDEVEGLFSCPLVGFFDEIVLSSEVGVSKPQNEIYQLACERLQLKPEKCIFVGASASKWMGVAIPYHPFVPFPDYLPLRFSCNRHTP